MDNLYSYEILGQNVKNAKYYFPYNEIIIKRLKKVYNYYIFVKEYDMENEYYNYFILFSVEKINNNCRRCRYDDYGRLRIKVVPEVKSYLESVKEFNVTYDSTNGEYDKYAIN